MNYDHIAIARISASNVLPGNLRDLRISNTLIILSPIALKNTCCSCKVPVSGFQSPHRLTTTHTSSSSGFYALLWPHWGQGPHAYMQARYPCTFFWYHFLSQNSDRFDLEALDFLFVGFFVLLFLILSKIIKATKWKICTYFPQNQVF